jgi:hypothetical protein
MFCVIFYIKVHGTKEKNFNLKKKKKKKEIQAIYFIEKTPINKNFKKNVNYGFHILIIAKE